MTFQPSLANAHVDLRPLVTEDWEGLYAVASDPLIWEQHPAHDRWQEPVFRAFFDAALASGGALVARDPRTGAIIGSSRFDRDCVQSGEIQIGRTFLARSHWGTPVNPSMKALMIAHALRSFERVIFLIGEHNIRSRRAVEKICAVLTPRTDTTIMAGTPVVHVIYAIDAPGFTAGPIAHLA